MKAEFNFEDVIDRVKKALKIKHDYELAEMLHIKKTTFNSRKKANSLPYDELFALANTKNLDFTWVLTGKGEMYQEAKNTVFLGKELDQQEQAAFKLFLALRPEQRKEISAVIVEKKRVLELESRVNQLEQRQCA